MNLSKILLTFLTPIMLMSSTQTTSAQNTEDRLLRHYDRVYVVAILDPGPIPGGFFVPTFTESKLEQLVVQELQRANIPISNEGNSTNVVRLVVQLNYAMGDRGNPRNIFDCNTDWNINTTLQGENLILGLGGTSVFGYHNSNNEPLYQYASNGCLDGIKTFINLWQTTH